MTDPTPIHEQAAARADALGLTQVKLAALLDCSQGRVSRILAGRASPTLRQAIALRDALSIDPGLWPAVAPNAHASTPEPGE